MIQVNHCSLPPKEKLVAYLDKIWASGETTNNGPLVIQLEKALKQYFNIPHLFLVSNGTWALQLIIKAYELKGEIITSPLSFIATTSSILYENCQPIFADVDPNSWCLSPKEVLRNISKKSKAILPVHLFGHPCDVKTLKTIALEENLKLIYDAAHAFGSTLNSKSICNFGDASAISLQAFKLFHTIEGGAILTSDDELADKLYKMRYFGKNKEGEINLIGTNAKLSELHAAVGLCNLETFKIDLQNRKEKGNIYLNYLKNTIFHFPKSPINFENNFSYFPILCPTYEQLIKTENYLKKENIKARRYFYPPLHKLQITKSNANLPIAESISPNILCLPIHKEVSLENIHLISKIVLASI